MMTKEEFVEQLVDTIEFDLEEIRRFLQKRDFDRVNYHFDQIFQTVDRWLGEDDL